MKNVLKRWRGKIFLVALVAAAGFGLYLGFTPRPLEVETAPVRRGPLQATVEQEGKTRVVDRYVVSAPVEGTAGRIDLEVGDLVEQGQTIVELSPLKPQILDQRRRAEAEARLAAAQSALKEAQERAAARAAEAEFAEGELTRTRSLFEAGSVSMEELKQSEAAAKRTVAERRSAEFAVDVARFEVEAAQTVLHHFGLAEAGLYEQIRIAAPVKGSVLKRFHESAGVVKGGDPLVELGDPLALEVEVDVLSADAVRIAPGMRVLLERWGGDEPIEARVRVVEPSGFTKISALGVEEQRVLVICDFASPPALWSRLGDGYRVEARFVLWEGANVLQVPRSALFRRAEEWAVFVFDARAGRTRARMVKPGHRSGLAAEIVEGLAEGEVVIPHPPRDLADGARVTPER